MSDLEIMVYGARAEKYNQSHNLKFLIAELSAFFMPRDGVKSDQEDDFMKIKNYDFLTWAKAAGVRALKTVAQTAVALIGTSVALTDVDWTLIVSASVLSGIVSILTSIAGLPELDATGADDE